MTKYPGAPELLHPSGEIIDSIAIYRNRFAGHGLLDRARIFSRVKNYNWRGFVLPDAQSQTLAAQKTYSDQVAVLPGSILVSISAYSQQPEGFRFQVTDRSSKTPIGSDYLRYMASTGGADGAKFPGRPLQMFLPELYVVGKDGVLMVQLTNLSASSNTINLFLQIAEPGRANVQSR